MTQPVTRGSAGGSVGVVLGRGLLGPLGGRERLHRQRVDLLAHSIAQCRVDPLVARDTGLAVELGRDDGREEMAAVSFDLEMRAAEPGGDEFTNVGGSGFGHGRNCRSVPYIGRHRKMETQDPMSVTQIVTLADRKSVV